MGGGTEVLEGNGSTGGSSSSNKMAECVLLRLQEKLEGVEDGVQLSVSGQAISFKRPVTLSTCLPSSLDGSHGYEI